MTYTEEFITFMVRSGVLTFGDFTTKSGRKTPYFVNTGNYKTGAQAAKLGDYYAACIQENMPQGITCLFGPAYKGIPLAVSAAASLYRSYDRDLPYCFNRKEAKDHGEGGTMVGYKPQDGDDVAIVEDVVTAGTAVRESIELFKSGALGTALPWTSCARTMASRCSPSSPCGRSSTSSTTALWTARSISTMT